MNAAQRYGARLTRKVRLLILLNVVAGVWYFGWLLQPGRAGNPWLYGALIVAELFNLVQAAGFWWTCSAQKVRPHVPVQGLHSVDVFIPTYNEPVAIVEQTVAAALRLTDAEVRVHLLDDGRRPEMAALAARHRVGYLTRSDNRGAKAGNINAALSCTDAEYVAVFDCDHVPHPNFLERTLGHLADEGVAFVQTPQYYGNADAGGVPAAAWAQQALFFGAILRGKDALGATFCCGTNVVFRRTALEEQGGFPEDSVTEDFALSIRLHERGWRSAYVDEVLAHGLAPTDMASYVGQQQRWARGCLAAIPVTLRARLPLRLKLQYLLSSAFFMSGWTVLVYMLLPAVATATGALPVNGATADEFLFHFAPYWALSLAIVAVVGVGSYTFAAFSLFSASFWIHVLASLQVATGRQGRFNVTPKTGSSGRQPRAVLPALVTIAALTACAAYGLALDRSAARINNVAFAALHIAVLASGALPALTRARPPAAREQRSPLAVAVGGPGAARLATRAERADRGRVIVGDRLGGRDRGAEPGDVRAAAPPHGR